MLEYEATNDLLAIEKDKANLEERETDAYHHLTQLDARERELRRE